MENGRGKIQKTSEKNQEGRPWGDLPQDILGIILGKLLDAVDVIRFRAVCKNWHIPKDEDHRNLPWLCSLSWAKDESNRLECELYDPYSRQIFITSKLVGGCRFSFCRIEVICSKQGWLIGHYYHPSMIKKEIFMYNPYCKEYIPLPCMSEYRICGHRLQPCFATFSGDPASQDCRVFVFSRRKAGPHSAYENYITSYDLNVGMKEWRLDFVDAKQEECCGMQYMNEQLLCLFKDGVMRRYSLADGSCTQLVSGEGGHRLAVANRGLWLVKGDGDILVACKLGIDSSKCSTFYFDWSNTSWVGISSNLQESSAIFISDNVTTFVRPFEEDYDDDDGENMKVYCFRELDHPSYYTFTETRKKQLKYCFSTVFIEPPQIN